MPKHPRPVYRVENVWSILSTQDALLTEKTWTDDLNRRTNVVVHEQNTTPSRRNRVHRSIFLSFISKYC